jgi:CRISPR/Cas system-associated endonuclease Cas1
MNRMQLVYDLMEPMRPFVDQKVLTFAFSNTFTAGDFTINRVGGCRLNPHMAKVVANQITPMGEDRIVKAALMQLQ